MKKIQNQSEKNSFENFSFKVLTESQMNEVRGGIRPKSRDRDIFDMES